MTNELVCDNDYRVEGLKHNLLSVAQLNKIGFKLEFIRGKAKLLDGKGNLVGSGKQTKGNILYLDLGKNSSFIAQVEESWLWHKRLCHIKFDNLVKISKHKRVRGLPSLRKPNMGLCKNFQIGKMGKTSFKSKKYYSKEVLEIFHTELCGPIGIKNYSGENFFIVFVDDYSRMMTIMYLKEKSKAFCSPSTIDEDNHTIIPLKETIYILKIIYSIIRCI